MGSLNITGFKKQTKPLFPHHICGDRRKMHVLSAAAALPIWAVVKSRPRWVNSDHPQSDAEAMHEVPQRRFPTARGFHRTPHPQRSRPRLHGHTVTSSVGMRQQPSPSHPWSERAGLGTLVPPRKGTHTRARQLQPCPTVGSLCSQPGKASSALNTEPAPCPSAGHLKDEAGSC